MGPSGLTCHEMFQFLIFASTLSPDTGGSTNGGGAEQEVTALGVRRYNAEELLERLLLWNFFFLGGNAWALSVLDGASARDMHQDRIDDDAAVGLA